MATVTATHVGVGLGGLFGGQQIVDQLSTVIAGHGVDLALAQSEAGLIVTVGALIGTAVWAIFKAKEPAVAQLLQGELASFEPDYEHQAAMTVAAVDKILAAKAAPIAEAAGVHAAATPASPA
jgi:hypothetical protein